jgi:hypothetical protein
MSFRSSRSKNKPIKKQHDLCLLPSSCWFLVWLNLLSWRRRLHVSPKCLLNFNGLQCVMCLGLTTLPPSVSRLSIQCGILHLSQPHRPPLSATGIALLFFTLHCAIFQKLQGFVTTAERTSDSTFNFYTFFLIYVILHVYRVFTLSEVVESHCKFK